MNSQKTNRNERPRPLTNAQRIELIKTMYERRQKLKKKPERAFPEKKVFFKPPAAGLKNCDDSAAEKLLKLVTERKPENVEPVKELLDKIWRKTMNGGTFTGKDYVAIDAGRKFLREVGLSNH